MFFLAYAAEFLVILICDFLPLLKSWQQPVVCWDYRSEFVGGDYSLNLCLQVPLSSRWDFLKWCESWFFHDYFEKCWLSPCSLHGFIAFAYASNLWWVCTIFWNNQLCLDQRSAGRYASQNDSVVFVFSFQWLSEKSSSPNRTNKPLCPGFCHFRACYHVLNVLISKVQCEGVVFFQCFLVYFLPFFSCLLLKVLNRLRLFPSWE